MTSAAFGDEQITCYVECSITVVLTPLLVTKSLLSEVYGELASTNIVVITFLAVYGVLV